MAQILTNYAQRFFATFRMACIKPFSVPFRVVPIHELVCYFLLLILRRKIELD